jgi:hypothetical protein
MTLRKPGGACSPRHTNREVRPASLLGRRPPILDKPIGRDTTSPRRRTRHSREPARSHKVRSTESHRNDRPDRPRSRRDEVWLHDADARQLCRAGRASAPFGRCPGGVAHSAALHPVAVPALRGSVVVPAGERETVGLMERAAAASAKNLAPQISRLGTGRRQPIRQRSSSSYLPLEGNGDRQGDRVCSITRILKRRSASAQERRRLRLSARKYLTNRERSRFRLLRPPRLRTVGCSRCSEPILKDGGTKSGMGIL